jgi:polyisoprenoid-binding protein YceI
MARIVNLSIALLPALLTAAPRHGPAAVTTPSAPAAIHYVVAPTGNAARYRVREQLMGHDLPNDAVGATTAVSGGIGIASDGTVVADDSKITIDVTGLKSDKDRRDGYVQRRLLETEQYPTVAFVPTEIRGLSTPLPTAAPATFDIVGSLTVRGVTHPTDWHVAAQIDGDDLTGSAWTTFTFADFGLVQPRVPVLLSVADTIRLEYDFHMVKAP